MKSFMSSMAFYPEETQFNLQLISNQTCRDKDLILKLKPVKSLCTERFIFYPVVGTISYCKTDLIPWPCIVGRRETTVI